MRQFGLIGYPLGHSFSASFFNSKFKEERIDATYRNFPLERISEFPFLLEQEPLLSGLNVTVPHKQGIIPYLDELSTTAAHIQAVNTISLKREGRSLFLAGDNTDVVGFRSSLEDHLQAHHKNALVLGSGGSSRAIRYVLDQLGIHFIQVSRTAGEYRISYEDVDETLIKNTSLIINTTPLGMYPEVESFPPIPYEALGPAHLLFDLVYNPETTAFLAKGKARGAIIVNGYAMLINQALASWKIWNNE
jgi:shikimate dehydrogenase